MGFKHRKYRIIVDIVIHIDDDWLMIAGTHTTTTQYIVDHNDPIWEILLTNQYSGRTTYPNFEKYPNLEKYFEQF